MDSGQNMVSFEAICFGWCKFNGIPDVPQSVYIVWV